MGYVKRRYKRDELLAILKDACDERGRAITMNEMRSSDWDGPNIRAYTNRFGSFNQAIALVGYKPNDGYNEFYERRVEKQMQQAKIKSFAAELAALA